MTTITKRLQEQETQSPLQGPCFAVSSYRKQLQL